MKSMFFVTPKGVTKEHTPAMLEACKHSPAIGRILEETGGTITAELIQGCPDITDAEKIVMLKPFGINYGFPYK